MDVPYWTLALLRSAILYSRGTILRNSMRVIWCVVLSFSDLCVLHANAFMCIVAAPLRELCECPDIPSMSSILTRNFLQTVSIPATLTAGTNMLTVAHFMLIGVSPTFVVVLRIVLTAHLCHGTKYIGWRNTNPAVCQCHCVDAVSDEHCTNHGT